MKVDLNKEIGTFILCFGNLERTVETSTLIISKKHFCNSKGYHIWIDNILKNLSMSKKINILKNLIENIKLEDCDKEGWNTLIKKISDLNEKRNIYAHGMYDIEDGKLLKMTNKRDKLGLTKDVLIELEQIVSDNHELHECYRQLYDSVIEPTAYGDSFKITWISKYKKLIW